MQEVFRTSDAVEISLLKSLLESAKIRYFVFNEHANAAFGGMGDMSECHFMVLDEDYDDAMEILQDAGLYDEDPYIDLFKTQDEEVMERFALAFDMADIDYILEEEEEYFEMIPKIGKPVVTYFFAVHDLDYDAAKDILLKLGTDPPKVLPS